MKYALESPFHFLTRALIPALGSLALARGAGAQCPVPDGLDGGPCCTLASEVLPEFPNVTQDALRICWLNCGLNSVAPTRARWRRGKVAPKPSTPDCGILEKRLDLLTSAGGVMWSGVMTLLYSRTWAEAAPGGALQVWRFLVNGDLEPTLLAGGAPCPLPPCAPAFGNRVKFSGYIDYAQNCATGRFESAWMLTHACDPIDHVAGFPRAGGSHPGRSYTFVGPAAGFVPAAVVAAEGTAGSAFDSVRHLVYPVPGTTGPVLCEFEERFGHSLTSALVCMCATATPVSAQWNLGSLSGGGVCGSSVTTGGSWLPGFVSMGIGSWTIPGVYPGAEDLRWNAGNYNYQESCPGFARIEVFFGVTTLGGYPATQVSSGPGLALPLTFIDQANSILPGGAPLMNVPFRSDHILNLNH